MSALSFIWIMIYAPQQCSHFPPTMRLIWGAPGPWSTVSLQYGVLQIFIILKPPNMSNYSAFKPTGGTSTGTRHHHHPSPSRATLARKYQGSHSALIRVDLNLGVWTYSWWWLRVADIVRYGLLHWLILGAQSAARNIWLYTRRWQSYLRLRAVSLCVFDQFGSCTRGLVVPISWTLVSTRDTCDTWHCSHPRQWRVTGDGKHVAAWLNKKETHFSKLSWK